MFRPGGPCPRMCESCRFSWCTEGSRACGHEKLGHPPAHS